MIMFQEFVCRSMFGENEWNWKSYLKVRDPFHFFLKKTVSGFMAKWNIPPTAFKLSGWNGSPLYYSISIPLENYPKCIFYQCFHLLEYFWVEKQCHVLAFFLATKQQKTK